MSENLSSNFAPEALYAEFEQFVERHQAMVHSYGNTYILVYMLVRLTREDVEKGRRVFNWAVKRVCLDMLGNEKDFPPAAKEISPQGRHWAERAEALFGQNPIKSLRMVEVVYLLERLALWAEREVQSQFGHKMTLAEFRKRPQSNEESAARMDWLDMFYQQARAHAIRESERYVQRRDVAIGVAITALAGGHEPSDREIEEALSANFPSHQAIAKWAADHNTHPSSLVAKRQFLEWVLGPPPEKEIAF